MTRIFLAASNELEADRRAFEQEVHRRNQVWRARGYEFRIDVWEDFDDSMSSTRKQDDYNASLRAADIVVVLVHTKVGKYTLEEFEAAWKQFEKTSRSGKKAKPGKPRIYTYFKGMPEAGEPDPGPQYATVRAFLKRLAQLGHWPNKYDEPSQLLHHFGGQIERLWAQGVIEPAKAATAAKKAAATPAPPSVTVANRGVFVGKSSRGAIITGTQTVHTGGGAAVFGSVETRGGAFTGRDQWGPASRKQAQGRASQTKPSAPPKPAKTPKRAVR